MLSGVACRRPLDGELLKVEPPAFCLKPSQQQVCSLTTAQLVLAVLACFHSLELPCCMTKTVSCWWRPAWAREHCRISPPRFLAECCKRQLNQGSFVLLYFSCLLYLICIEFVYLYFPVLFCLSVSVKWLVVKTASEMTYTVSSGALNSTTTPAKFAGSVGHLIIKMLSASGGALPPLTRGRALPLDLAGGSAPRPPL